MIDNKRIISFQNRKVWQLSTKEVDWVYKNLHMNSYVRAALLMYHNSPHPAGRGLSLRKEAVPPYLQEPINSLLSLSPNLNRDEPAIVRKHCLLHCYTLFRSFRELKAEDIRIVIDLLAATAFIPVIAEKNDDFPLWMHSVVRKPSPAHIRCFEEINENIDIESYIRIPFFDEEIREEDEIPAEQVLFYFMPRAVSSIIARIENAGNTRKATAAFQIVEKAMLLWEEENGLSGESFGPLRLKSPGQIRYRNTLYLYGGDHLVNRNMTDEAFNWYCRDIASLRLPQYSGFFLTDLKTCERLIRAWPLHPKKEQKNLFRSLIDEMLFESLRNSAEHAQTVLSLIDDDPSQDLSAMSLKRKNGRPLLFAGEAMREIFLISLLYKHHVDEIDFPSLDYSRLLEIQ